MSPLDLIRVLSEFALVVLIPLLIWNARLMMDFREGLRELRQAMYGVNGDNGINSEVKALRVSRHQADTLLTTHSFRLEEHGEAIQELKARLP